MTTPIPQAALRAAQLIFDEWFDSMERVGFVPAIVVQSMVEAAHQPLVDEVESLRQDLRRAIIRAESTERYLTEVCRAVDPMCPCNLDPETTNGPERSCPLHGDSEYVARMLRSLLTSGLDKRIDAFVEMTERG
jgi:hypothetical protein